MKKCTSRLSPLFPVCPHYFLERISQNWQPTTGNWQPAFYGYDGHGSHGSVRFLTDTTGAVIHTYDYDAFGNLVNQTGSTPNDYLFAGEQYDPALGLYYNRARYLNTSTGRFWSMDDAGGGATDPRSAHRYLFNAADPVNKTDRSGHDFVDAIGAVAVENILVAQTVIGAAAGGAFGCIAGALDSQSTCRQGFFSGILSGAVFGALGGAYLGTSFGASAVGGRLLSLAAAGLGGTSAYYAAQRHEYSLAIFYAFTAVGTSWLIANRTPVATGSPTTGGSGSLPPAFSFLSEINPSGSVQNCVYCTIAVDDALAGGPVKPASPTAGPMDIRLLVDRFGTPFTDNAWTPASIEQSLAASGPGSRGIVYGGFANGSPGHVFNVVNYEGAVYYLDGQTGGAAQPNGYDFYWLLRTH